MNQDCINELKLLPHPAASPISIKNMFKTKKNTKKSRKFEFKSVNELYDIENFSHSSFFSSVDLDNQQEGIRVALGKWFDSPPSSIHLHGLRIKPAIELFKSFGKLSNIFSFTFFSDKPNCFFLVLEVGSSQIFILNEDVKYLQKDLVARNYGNYDDSSFIDNHMPHSSTTYLFFRPDDILAYKIATDLSEECSVRNAIQESVLIDMIISGQQGLQLRSIKLEPPQDFDLALHYGESFVEYDRRLLERLDSRNKGIVMLHGPPGTGKTHYIRSLLPKLADMEKRVVLIPKHVISSLESPQFNAFMLENFTDHSTVFIIEDAESIISKRDSAGGHRSELVSTILNITDGILNDIFNIQVILTFNTEISSIDEALLRKGRLISKYEFGYLDRDAARKLGKKIGVEITGAKQQHSLAEIYALKESETDEILINQNIPKQKTFVGF